MTPPADPAGTGSLRGRLRDLLRDDSDFRFYEEVVLDDPLRTAEARCGHGGYRVVRSVTFMLPGDEDREPSAVTPPREDVYPVGDVDPGHCAACLAALREVLLLPPPVRVPVPVPDQEAT